MFPEGFHFMPGVDGQLFTGSRNTAAGLNQPRWAVITDTMTGGNTFPTFYGWKEQTWVGAVLVDQNGGMFGTPAKNPVVDPNNAQLNVGDNVLLQMAYFDPARDWVFAVVSKGAGAAASSGGGGGPATLTWGTCSGGLTTLVHPLAVTPMQWAQGAGPLAYNDGTSWHFKIPQTQPITGYYHIRGSAWFQQSQSGAGYGCGFNVTINQPSDLTSLMTVPGQCNGDSIRVQFDDTLVFTRGQLIDFDVYHDQVGDNNTCVGISMFIQYQGVS